MRAPWAEEAERARVAASSIQGWLSDRQGRALFEAAARTSGRGLIVEIGSWHGRSTVWLAYGARLAGGRVHAVDPHRGSREDPAAQTLDAFLGNLRRAGVHDIVEPVIMASDEAAAALRDPVELLFIDGDHSYGGVRRDAELWLPRLVEGGTVLFHDVATAGYSGPRRVFQRLVCRDSRFDRIRRVGSMSLARRTPRRALPSAAWARTAGLLLYLFDAKSALKRVRGRT